MDIRILEKMNARFGKVLNAITKRKATPISAISINNVARFSTGTVISGILVCADNCFFDGQMNGELEAINKLVLGKNSEVVGTVYAGDLMVKGKIRGNVIVNNKAIYCSTSSIIAESLQTNFLVVENGAVLNLSNLSMQLDRVDASLCVCEYEHDSTPNSRTKMKRTDTRDNLKINSEAKCSNRNDDVLLFQFFQNKENNLK
jgi:cytoskeletal protein CcmA (bactofilin family)